MTLNCCRIEILCIPGEYRSDIFWCFSLSCTMWIYDESTKNITLNLACQASPVKKTLLSTTTSLSFQFVFSLNCRPFALKYIYIYILTTVGAPFSPILSRTPFFLTKNSGSLAVQDPFSSPSSFAFPDLSDLGPRLYRSNWSRQYFDKGMKSQPLALLELFKEWNLVDSWWVPQTCSGWWKLIFFPPRSLGKMNPFGRAYFSKGWFNHQLVFFCGWLKLGEGWLTKYQLVGWQYRDV